MKIKLVSLLLLACLLLTFASCNKYGIEEPEPELVFPSTVDREMTLTVGETVVNSYIMYKGLIDFSSNDIIFISSNPLVASVKIASQEFPIYTYFDIEALSVGETVIHAEARDGTIFSELIKVTVVEATESEPTVPDASEKIDEAVTAESDLPEIESQTEPPEVEKDKTEAKPSYPEIRETESIIVTFSPETSAPQTEAPSTTEAATEKVTEKPKENVSVTYILNTNSKKFHYPTCSFVKRMNEENKQSYTGSREALIAEGYSACKTCKC